MSNNQAINALAEMTLTDISRLRKRTSYMNIVLFLVYLPSLLTLSDLFATFQPAHTTYSLVVFIPIAFTISFPFVLLFMVKISEFSERYTALDEAALKSIASLKEKYPNVRAYLLSINNRDFLIGRDLVHIENIVSLSQGEEHRNKNDQHENNQKLRVIDINKTLIQG